MSNAIRYDSLLVRYLGLELGERYRGRRVEALRLDAGGRTAALVIDGQALVWRLHPDDGRMLVTAAPAVEETVPLPRRATIRQVTAPLDERLLVFELDSPRPRPDRAQRIVVELMGNQWNVVAVDAAGRVVAALWRRSAGARRLVPGALYRPPPAAERCGRDAPLSVEEWRGLLGSVPPDQRARTLIDAVAYTSPINAGPILGAAAESPSPVALDAAYDRYVALASLPAASPRLLRTPRGPQPYPLPLDGVPDEPHASLLNAFAAVGGEAPPAAAVPSALLDRLRGRLEQLERRRRRLAEELAGAGPEAERLRRQADLLLSQLHLVRKGAVAVELSDFEGGTIEVALDPALSPTENAQRLYEAAKKRERAAGRLPGLIERAESERDRHARLLERTEAGEATVEEVEAVLGPAAVDAGGRKAAPGAALPYRRYRTSGGFEVRVGRGRKANDDLTFHHSAPNDVWLHARDVGGAHVILRWSDASANPPARDLTEAANLAALHSKARTSGTVAVDWTRRKHVRKPRKAPPGLVVMERGKTVFVEPDAALEERLRD